jgi:hypothetical protein
LAKKPISVELSRIYMLIREGAGSVQIANCARFALIVLLNIGFGVFDDFRLRALLRNGLLQFIP